MADRPSRRTLTAVRIAALYLLFGIVWIVGSDWVVPLVTDDPRIMSLWQTGKGALFIGVTAALLYLLLKRFALEIQQVERQALGNAARFRSLFDHSEEGMMLAAPTGRILAANSAACRLLGHREEDLRRLGRQGIVVQDERVDKALEERDRTGHSHHELSLVRADGTEFPAEVTATLFRDADGAQRVSIIFRDISERRQAEAQARLAASVLDNTVEGVLVLNTRGDIVWVNRAFSQLTGHAEEDVRHRPHTVLWAEQDVGNGVLAKLWRQLEAQGHWQGELWARRRDSEVFPGLFTFSAVRDEDGNLTHYIAIFNDVSQIHDYERRLEFLARHDPLTELPNRHLAEELLGEAVARAQRHMSVVGVLLIDLEGLKHVNDSLGHAAGDELLRVIAGRLRELVREADLVAHLGADKFLVVLDELSEAQDAAMVADKVLTAVSEPTVIHDQELFLGANIGISCYPGDAWSAEQLIRNADTAVYKAKELGANSYRFFSPEMNNQAFEAMVMATHLRRALERNELEVEYQPVIELNTGRITAVEALARWRHPELGDVSPERFIPAAERAGLIDKLGQWVLQSACRQIRKWQDAGLPPIRVAVNLSPRQFGNPGILESITSVLVQAGLNARHLELEITESTFMADPERTRQVLGELSAMGVTIAIDDFGTGYSSLSYLKHFPVDYIKIDRSFIDGILKDPDDLAITRAVIALARSLNIQTVAEGIETEQQRKLLATEGCREGQGFLFSRARPGDDLNNMLARNTA